MWSHTYRLFKITPSTFIDFLDFFPVLVMYNFFFQKIPLSTFIPTSTVIREMRVETSMCRGTRMEVPLPCSKLRRSEYIGMKALPADSIILGTRRLWRIFPINQKFNSMTFFIIKIFKFWGHIFNSVWIGWTMVKKSIKFLLSSKHSSQIPKKILTKYTSIRNSRVARHSTGWSIDYLVLVPILP